MSCGTIFLQREGRRVSGPKYSYDSGVTSRVEIPVLKLKQECRIHEEQTLPGRKDRVLARRKALVRRETVRGCPPDTWVTQSHSKTASYCM